MRLTVVGCSGSFPGPDSPASCYLLEADGFRLVIDFGNGSLGALQKYCGLFDIDAVCLSHLHADHCVDLYSYSVARTYAPAGVQPAIPVYGPAGSEGRMSLIHGPDGDDGLMKRFLFETLAPGRMMIGPFDVELAHVNHPVETFGFRFSRGGRSLVYTGDTGETEAVPALAAGADVFLSEAAFLEGPDLPPGIHLTARQAAAYASQAGVGRLVLTHLQPWNSLDDARAEAASEFGGDLDIARPGQVVDLAGLTPLSGGPFPARWRLRAAAGGVGRLVCAYLRPWGSVDGARAEAASEFGGGLGVARPGQVVDLAGLTPLSGGPFPACSRLRAATGPR